MIDWALVLTPLLVLPIVLLFRFVGCGLDIVGSGDFPPRYRDYILAEPDNGGTVKNPAVKPDRGAVVGYWRLVAGEHTKIIADETGTPGSSVYTETPLPLPEIAPVPPAGGSSGASGRVRTGYDSLITVPPSLVSIRNPIVQGRFFEGGFAFVMQRPNLYFGEFSIEAWVEVRWSAAIAGFEHTLFSAGGHYRRPFTSEPAGFHGFRLFADKDNRWQVALDGLAVFTLPPAVARDRRCHVVLTVARDGGQHKATLFLDGKVAAMDGAPGYSTPDGAPLFIGVGNAANAPDVPAVPTKPFVGRIQEVVLYNRALSQEEVENHFSLNPKE